MADKVTTIEVLGVESIEYVSKKTGKAGTMRKARVRGMFTLSCFIGPDGKLQAPRIGDRALIEEAGAVEKVTADVGVYDIPNVEATKRAK